MALQYISDQKGEHTAVIIPIEEWRTITAKHQDLNDFFEKKDMSENKAGQFKGLLTNEEAKKYHEYINKPETNGTEVSN